MITNTQAKSKGQTVRGPVLPDNKTYRAITYTETIFPKENNTYLARNRYRSNFAPVWRALQIDRVTTSSIDLLHGNLPEADRTFADGRKMAPSGNIWSPGHPSASNAGHGLASQIGSVRIGSPNSGTFRNMFSQSYPQSLVTVPHESYNNHSSSATASTTAAHQFLRPGKQYSSPYVIPYRTPFVSTWPLDSCISVSYTHLPLPTTPYV